MERGDLKDPARARQLAEALDRRLAADNIEYASKRDSQRLGMVRLAARWRPAPGSEWDRQRLARTGGTLEQYKHPCLIADLKFRESMRVEGEIRADEEVVTPR